MRWVFRIVRHSEYISNFRSSLSTYLFLLLFIHTYFYLYIIYFAYVTFLNVKFTIYFYEKQKEPLKTHARCEYFAGIQQILFACFIYCIKEKHEENFWGFFVLFSVLAGVVGLSYRNRRSNLSFFSLKQNSKMFWKFRIFLKEVKIFKRHECEFLCLSVLRNKRKKISITLRSL